MNNYPDSYQREQISKKTGLCDSRIQVWFSNRRARSRKHMIFSGLPQVINSSPPILSEKQQSTINLPINLLQNNLPPIIPNFNNQILNVQTALANALLQFQLNNLKNTQFNLLNPHFV